MARAPRRGRAPGRRAHRHRRSRPAAARRRAAGQHPGHADRDGGRRRSAATCCAASTTPDAATAWPATSPGSTARSCSPTPRTAHLLDGLDLPGVRVLDVSQPRMGRADAQQPGPLTPHREVGPDDTFMMIFTSGTSGDPKAVQVQHMMLVFAGSCAGRTVFGHHLRRLLPVDAAVPLQRHLRGLGGGAGDRGRDGARRVLGLALPRRRPPLRRHLHELRRQAARVRPGHPRAARRPRQPAARRVRQRGQRPRHRRVRPPVRLHGLGRLRLDRERGHHHPRGRLPGRARSARASPAWRSTTRRRCRSARSRGSTRPATLVNRDGGDRASWSTPPAAGCSAATTTTPAPPIERLRHGMYWSGDLAYRDADGWIYLAGRTADWMRVDGENLAAAPIERILIRLPAISRVAVYPVPDELGRRPGDGGHRAARRRDVDAPAFDEFLAAPARPVAEGLAALRLDRRRSARHRDQQDPQAGAASRRPHPDGVLWNARPRVAVPDRATGQRTLIRPARIGRRQVDHGQLAGTEANPRYADRRLGVWRLTWHNGPPTSVPVHVRTDLPSGTDAGDPAANDRRGHHEIGYSP